MPPDYTIDITPSGSGYLVFSWLTESGTTYRLQARTNLVEGIWENIGDPVFGSEADQSITNVPAEGAGFCRILVE